MQMVLVDSRDRTYIYWQLYSKSEKVRLENFTQSWVGNVRTSNIPSKACHNKAINVGERIVCLVKTREAGVREVKIGGATRLA